MAPLGVNGFAQRFRSGGRLRRRKRRGGRTSRLRASEAEQKQTLHSLRDRSSTIPSHRRGDSRGNGYGGRSADQHGGCGQRDAMPTPRRTATVSQSRSGGRSGGSREGGHCNSAGHRVPWGVWQFQPGGHRTIRSRTFSLPCNRSPWLQSGLSPVKLARLHGTSQF